MRKLLTLLALALGLAAVPAASAAPNLLVGVTDDNVLWNPAQTVGVLDDLGMRIARVTVLWEPGRTAPTPEQFASLDAAVAAAGTSIRLVPIVYGRSGDDAPADMSSAITYCTFVKSLIDRYPTINDVAVWVEPNKSGFWKPQFDGRYDDSASVAPAAYAALLATCWDMLHAARPGVNVIGGSTAPRGNDRPDAASNISHSPGNFIVKMGMAYRLMGRSAPIFDTYAHHVYGEHSAQRPWKTHDSSTISTGDWQALMQALYDGFVGTGQPIPGEDGVEIWYTEAGYQTTIAPEKAALYSGAETDGSPVSPAAGALSAGPPLPDAASDAPDQGTQLADAIRLAACQPHVGAFLNFGLVDEAQLGRWQAGLLWTDWTPKPSYETVRSTVAALAAGQLSCGVLADDVPAVFEPKEGVLVDKLLLDHQAEVWELINDSKTYVYVAGLPEAAQRFEKAMIALAGSEGAWLTLRGSLVEQRRYAELLY